MGEAKRRAEAFAHGRSWQPEHRCPTCRSTRLAMTRVKTVAAMAVKTVVAECADCGQLWEAYPPDWKEDPVLADPCDNCAFRPGSAELADKEGWQHLLADLKNGREFRCHKGAPMHVDTTTMSAEFDRDWIQRRGRTCAGFLKAMRQWPDWFERHVARQAGVDLGEGEPWTDDLVTNEALESNP